MSLLVALLAANHANAQQLGFSQLEALGQKTDTQRGYADRLVTYGFGTKRKAARLNPFYHILASGMWVYQRCVSPVISRSCAYAPSCSGYSKALIGRYGLLRGTFFTADRLMRCTRISLADPATYRLVDQSDGHIHESVERYNMR